ncbi:MAG TPA: hypothetical protein DIT13_18375 [Verrucomicrobiales bacterium]|nr:hypothetical protein [Verrucomicrobiales bacterium]
MGRRSRQRGESGQANATARRFAGEWLHELAGNPHASHEPPQVPAPESSPPPLMGVFPLQKHMLPWQKHVLPRQKHVLPWQKHVLPWQKHVLPWQKHVLPWQKHVFRGKSMCFRGKSMCFRGKSMCFYGKPLRVFALALAPHSASAVFRWTGHCVSLPESTTPTAAPPG